MGSRARQRRNRAQHRTDDVNRACAAVNWLAGIREPPSKPEAAHRGFSDAHLGLYARISESLAGHTACGEEDTAIPEKEAALRDVLRGRGLYEASGDINLATFTKMSAVSLPDSVWDAPMLDSITVGTEAHQPTCEGNAERMLKCDSELDACGITPYWDVVLRTNRKKRLALYKDLMRCGLVVPAPAGTAVEQLGNVFC